VAYRGTFEVNHVRVLAVRVNTVSNLPQKKTKLDFYVAIIYVNLFIMGPNTCWGSGSMLGWIRIFLVQSENPGFFLHLWTQALKRPIFNWKTVFADLKLFRPIVGL
jgi:hypothetical protein